MSAPTSSAIAVRVLLFASYAERLGRAEVELRLAPGATAADAVASLRVLPGGGDLPPRPLTARNLAHCAPDTPLTDGDELAVLPPMAGG